MDTPIQEADYDIEVAVNTTYLSEQSAPHKKEFVFAYTITITNIGRLTARLMSRHWIITNGNQRVKEVKGKGVIGDQPLIPSGKSYTYSSHVVLETAVGTMEGSYEMLASDGKLFKVMIDPFSLAVPHAVH